VTSGPSYSPGPGSARTLRLYGCFVVSGGCNVLHNLKVDQPLALHRIMGGAYTLAVSDLNGAPFSYVHPYDAAWLTARIDAGEIWLAKLKRGCVNIFASPLIEVWRDGVNVKDEETVAQGPVEKPVFRKFKMPEKEKA